MNTSESRALKRVILGLVTFRWCVLFLRAFLPLTLPEIWRQIDTLGVSLRYWTRWNVDHDFSLLPAVLNSGDSRGIMPMEFPLLNIIAAPAFSLGPWLGVAAAQCILFSLLLILVVVNARVWRGVQIYAIDAENAMWMLPIFSFGAVWGGKFMPDFLSVLLVVLAVGISWKEEKPFLSGALGALGMLIKPTSAVVLIILLLRQKLKWRWMSLWPAVSVIVGAFYYTVGTSYLSHYVVGEPRFAVGSQPITRSIVEFFTVPETGELLYKHLFFPGGIVLVCFGFLGLKAFPVRLVAVVLIQMFSVAALSGAHGLTHPYYYMGLTPVLALIYLYLYVGLRSVAIRVILLLLLSIHLLDKCNMEIHTLYSRAATKAPPTSQCKELLKRHPEFPWGRGEVFRSPDGSYPELGLCFGERENSKVSRFGFWWKKYDPPRDCVVVDESAEIWLLRCGNT
jgi:hypothetical protein